MSKLSPIFLISGLSLIISCAHKPSPTADSTPFTEDKVAAVADTPISATDMYVPDTPTPVIPKTKKSVSKAKKKATPIATGQIHNNSSGGTSGTGGNLSDTSLNRAPASVGEATPTDTPVVTETTEAGGGTNWLMWIIGFLIATIGATIYHHAHKTHKSDLLYHTH